MNNVPNAHEKEMSSDVPFLIQLIELRRRALYVLIVFIFFFVLFFFFSAPLFQQLIAPLFHILPTTKPLIATQLVSPVLIPIQLSMDAALFTTTPYLLIQIWCFVAPGLYRQERCYLRWIILGSLSLFLGGVLFSFYVVLPFMLQFFAQAVPMGVQYMPEVGATVDFITHMLLLFGFCFQVPLISFLLVYLECIEVSTLKIIRPYVIVGSFIIGMLLTPPDVLSQLLLAVPLCLLYELGLLLAIFFSGEGALYER